MNQRPMEDKQRENRGTIGCGLFFMLFSLYLLWPLIRMLAVSIFYSVKDTWPHIRIPALAAFGAWVLWSIFSRLFFGRKMSYENIQKLVWETGERYARQQGIRVESSQIRRWEAPGYTVSDFIDRYGISPQMDRELVREFKRAFR